MSKLEQNILDIIVVANKSLFMVMESGINLRLKQNSIS